MCNIFKPLDLQFSQRTAKIRSRIVRATSLKISSNRTKMLYRKNESTIQYGPPISSAFSDSHFERTALRAQRLIAAQVNFRFQFSLDCCNTDKRGASAPSRSRTYITGFGGLYSIH